MPLRLFVWALSLTMFATIAGCNSTETALQPTPSDVAAAQNSEIANVDAAVRFRLAPVVGAPVEQVSVLTRRLSLRAREKEYALVRSDSGNENHVLKGYFSAFTEGSQTTVVFVWDILDTSGNRLHRFQGQEQVQGPAGTSGWDAVTAEAMESVADQTANALAEWAPATS